MCPPNPLAVFFLARSLIFYSVLRAHFLESPVPPSFTFFCCEILNALFFMEGESFLEKSDFAPFHITLRGGGGI